MNEKFDVIIVGGGVVGSAVAYFLAAESSFTGRIAVIETDPTYAEASTPRSVGGIRQQYSTIENIRMSQFGITFYREAADRLAVEGDRPDLGFREAGYLMLASQAGAQDLAANHARQTREGAHVALMTPDHLAKRFPWLNTDGVGAGTLGLKDEGWIDPYSLLQAFRRKARALGVSYLHDRVTGLGRRGDRLIAVETASGRTIACGTVVNAAGPRASAVAELAGVELPVRPRKRMVYVFDCRTPIPDCPLLIDSSGVYVRPESGQFICGTSPPADRDPDTLDLEPDYSLFEDMVWPVLALRVPAFAAIKLNRAWAGLYAYNTLDQNAILGPHPVVENLFFANGFSGHGLQQSPAAGRAISELITFGQYRTLDLGRFCYDRIARGEPIRELNVV